MKIPLNSSMSAGYEFTRRDGGQRKALLRVLEPFIPYSCSFQDTLVAITISAGCVRSVWERGPTNEDLLEAYLLLHRKNPWLRNVPAQCTPHGILEPMKVRIITKGDCFSGSFLGGVKDDLRDLLWGLPNDPFCLLNRSKVEDKDLRRLLTETTGYNKFLKGPVDDKLFWLSGDFSSATDNANGLISERVGKNCLRFLQTPEPFFSMALRSLCKNRITWCEKALGLKQAGFRPDKFNECFDQSNGQLMGSIISFPILCMMNLFSYWESIEKWLGYTINLEKLLKKFPVLINGDDILFRCPSSLYPIWSEVTASYGFDKSVGKNLFLEKALTINSQYVEQHDGEFIFHEYLNHGMINGIRKGDSVTSERPQGAYGDPNTKVFYIQMAVAYKELLSIKKEGVKKRALSKFFENYSVSISEMGLEWFQENYQSVIDYPLKGSEGYSIYHSHLVEDPFIPGFWKRDLKKEGTAVLLLVSAKGDIGSEDPDLLNRLVLECRSL